MLKKKTIILAVIAGAVQNCFAFQQSTTVRRQQATFPVSSLAIEAVSVINEDDGGRAKRICVIAESSDEAIQKEAGLLASRLMLPHLFDCDLHDENFDTYHHAMTVSPWTVGELQSFAVGIQPLLAESNKRKKPTRKASSLPLAHIIDFLPPNTTRLGKRTKGQSGTDLLVKAVSPRKSKSSEGEGAVIYDMTAGFGQDSLILAQNGASRVIMVERDPIVATLLEDAMRRLTMIAETDLDETRQLEAQNLSNKLSIVVDDARDLSKELHACDVCYLDPMFPPRQKSAAVKKNMQILHGLLESQEVLDLAMEAELLETALSMATARVIVKRPINAPILGDRKPSYDVRGSTNRWDVYVLS